MRVRLQIQSVPQPVDGLPDEALGDALVGLVRDALGRGTPPTVATIARADRVDLVALAPVVESGLALPGFLASLTRAELDPGMADARAVGLMGTLRVRRDGQEAPMAAVFLEWPDCRWWHWRALIDPTGALRADTETVRRAVDGDPLPDGLGRWWSLGRRQPHRVRLAAAPDTSSPLVH